MKAKINKGSYLEIERAGKFKAQLCPFESDAKCGDYCPLFGEPVIPGTGQTFQRSLEICNGKILFLSELIDERE